MGQALCRAIKAPGPAGGAGWTGGLERSMFNAVQTRIMFFRPIIFAIVLNAMSILAATPEVAPTGTVSAAAAEPGKDVVHQLNNAFAKVFESVAPSVVII